MYVEGRIRRSWASMMQMKFETEKDSRHNLCFISHIPQNFTRHVNMQILILEEIVGYRISKVIAMLLIHRPQFE